MSKCLTPCVMLFHNVQHYTPAVLRPLGAPVAQQILPHRCLSPVDQPGPAFRLLKGSIPRDWRKRKLFSSAIDLDAEAWDLNDAGSRCDSLLPLCRSQKRWHYLAVAIECRGTTASSVHARSSGASACTLHAPEQKYGTSSSQALYSRQDLQSHCGTATT